MASRARVTGRGQRGALLLALCLPAALFASDATADGVTPVVVTMLGPGAVRIRVALGNTFPCDSGDDQRIIDGKFRPGEVLHTSTPERCLCVQQTYEPFSDLDWGAASIVCRPQLCTRAGKGQICRPAADPTIRLQIRSTRP